MSKEHITDPAAIYALQPQLAGCMSMEKVRETLAGSANLPVVQAMLSLAKHSREPILQTICDPNLTDAQLRHCSGMLAASAELEEAILLALRIEREG